MVRPDIVAALDEAAATASLTAISAPTGFGKTVAAAQWAQRRLLECPGSTSWLAFTREVADRSDILRALLAAIHAMAQARADQQLTDAVAAVSESTSLSAAWAGLASLHSAEPLTVILDDFQLALPALDDAELELIVNHGLPWLRLVVILSGGIPQAWTRARFHGTLAVIESAQLAFGAAEVRSMADRLGHQLTSEQAGQIVSITGGWPSAVRLAILGGDASVTVGDSVQLTDYIHSAVLGRLAPELAEFVLATTIVDCLDIELAGALSGQTDCKKLIDDCFAAALFISRFSDKDRTSYRWHALFSEHCRRILRQTDPDRWRRLNAAAAQYLRANDPLGAIHHAITATDCGLAGDILADHWLEMLLQSRARTLDRTCTTVMQSCGESAELLAMRAACLDLAGDTVGANLLLARSQSLISPDKCSARTIFITNLVAVLLSKSRSAIFAAAADAEATLSSGAVIGSYAYACSLFLLGWAHSRLREAQHGAELLRAAVTECRALGLHEIAERARLTLAFATAQAGDFITALEIVAQGRNDAAGELELWLWHDGDGAEELTRGWVRFWQGEPEAALSNFLTASAAKGTGYPDVAKLMAAYCVAIGGEHSSLATAEMMLDQIPDVDTHGVPWTDFTLGGKARLAEMRGEPAQALELACALGAGSHMPTVTALTAGLCRRLGDTDAARRLGEAGSAAHTQPYSQAYALLVLALLEWDAGDKRAAHTLLETSLALCAPQRILLPFLDNADAQCRDLLASHAAATAHPKFLAACRSTVERTDARGPAGNTAKLTRREIEVLTCLRTPHTFTEIAEQLGISINTIKTHQRAIYRKLGVTNRREAVRLAHSPSPFSAR